MDTNVDYPMRADSIFPREDVARAETGVETSELATMAEEPPEAIQARLQRAQDQIDVIKLILHHKNYASDEEKLRQVRVVVE